ncbi:unnamed protein product [Phaedon cochleariae]|uniref:Uncharacterized protein n=1 Tax=Phaedon cochleariae TaxID=80249 RepID=A0A9N9SDT4_PHACE|nr:unnamed protein product [Phaedon cochleariae]
MSEEAFFGRSGLLETHVRGQWYRVFVTLEDDYLSITLDEAYENTTTLNGTGTLNNNVETPGGASETPEVPESVANQKRTISGIWIWRSERAASRIFRIEVAGHLLSRLAHWA